LVAKGGVYAKLVEIQTKRMANSLLEPNQSQGSTPLDQIDSIFVDVDGEDNDEKSVTGGNGRGGKGGGRGGRGGGRGGRGGHKEEI
jgi:hypothetical protein